MLNTITKEELKTYIKLHTKVCNWFHDMGNDLADDLEDAETEDDDSVITKEIKNIIASGGDSEYLRELVDTLDDLNCLFSIKRNKIHIDSPSVSFDIPIKYLNPNKEYV